MNALNEHWEKLVLVVVLVIALAVIGKAIATGSETDTFNVKPEATEVAQSALVGIPGLVEISKAEAPKLAKNVFEHEWLQRSTANQQALTLKWGLVCDETGQRILYRADSDGDGIPNEWEQKYGLDWTNPNDANLDPDNDTFTNKQEYDLSVAWSAEVLPMDPQSPNVVAQDLRIGKIYHPERNFQLGMFTKGQTLKFKYNGKFVPVVKLDDKEVETGKDGEGKVFFIESVEEVLNDKGKLVDYKVTVKDGETGESFVCQKNQKSLEAYGIVELVSKDDANKKQTCKVGDEIEVPMVKKNGVITAIDVEGKTVTVKVNGIEYTVTE